MGKETTVRIGVFIPTECQLLDQACVDVFGSMSHEYLKGLTGYFPKILPIVDLAPTVDIRFIGTVKAGEHITLTTGQKIVATNRYSDAEVAPGKLQIVIVPGPDPATPWGSKNFKAPIDWLHRQGQSEGTDILSVCSGIFLCGEAGLLKGKRVCGPRGMQDLIKVKYGEDVIQKGEDLRWIQDGNFWSSGGITNGNDLVAAYARHSKHFPTPVAEFSIALTEVGDRPQQYSAAR